MKSVITVRFCFLSLSCKYNQLAWPWLLPNLTFSSSKTAAHNTKPLMSEKTEFQRELRRAKQEFRFQQRRKSTVKKVGSEMENDSFFCFYNEVRNLICLFYFLLHCTYFIFILLHIININITGLHVSKK